MLAHIIENDYLCIELKRKGNYIMKEENIQISFYVENGTFCAYIGSDGGSGYKCFGSDMNELADNIANYIKEYIKIE